VQAVGDQGGGADAPADGDAVAGDEFVSGEPDQRGDRDGPEVPDGGRVQQPADGFVAGGGGGGGDDQDDGGVWTALSSCIWRATWTLRRPTSCAPG
jgi:hypothetical protein